MKIFLIGGGGYVGSALVPKLLEEGYEVTVFDLFIYGKEVLDDHLVSNKISIPVMLSSAKLIPKSTNIQEPLK